MASKRSPSGKQHPFTPQHEATGAGLQPTSLPRPKPLVFISHDTRDAEIAETFANLLQDASGGVLRSFRSSDRRGTTGIEFGAEWYAAIMDKLKDATDCVALLTEQSLGRPWLLYEAGVAKGRLDSVVFGLALGVPLDRAGVGPFAQFQNCGDDEDSLTKLVLQLIRRNPEADPREEAVRRQVKAFKESVASILKARPKEAAPAHPAVDPSAVARLFEEVKVMFRQLPDQLELSIERRLRRPGVHVAINRNTVSDLYDALSHSTLDDLNAWDTVCSLARKYVPSAYGPARVLRHALRIRDAKGIVEAREVLLAALQDGRLEVLTPPKGTDIHELNMMLMAFLSGRFVKQLSALGISLDEERRTGKTASAVKATRKGQDEATD